MPELDVTALEPGMLLAEDVFNCDGQLLLPAGYVLRERHILMLKAWGVRKAIIGSDVDGPDFDLIAAGADLDLEPRQRRHFQFQDPTHPITLELVRLWKERRVQASRQGEWRAEIDGGRDAVGRFT